MQKVSRAEFMEFVRSHDLRAHPTTGHQIAVMQYLDGDRVMAQAVYEKYGPARYEVRHALRRP